MKYIINVFLLILFITTSLFGQYNEEVTITAPYQPRISAARKISYDPKIEREKSEQTTNFSYQIQSFEKFDSDLELAPISAVKMVKKPIIKKILRNYIKLGYGNYKTPFAEFLAHSLQSDKYGFGAHLKHHSSTGQINDYAKNAFSENVAEVFGKLFTNSHNLSAKAYYKRNGLHFYGFKPDDFPAFDYSDDDIKQYYSLVGGQVAAHSNHKVQIKNALQLDYYRLSDNFEEAENSFSVKAKIQNPFSISRKNNGRVTPGLAAGFQYYNNHTGNNTLNSSLLSLNPYLLFDFNEYTIKIGTNVDFDAMTGAKSHLKIYPDIYTKLNIIPSAFAFYAGLQGNTSKNSLKSFSGENPFIINGLDKKFTYHKTELFGGFNSHFLKYFTLNSRLSFAKVDDMHFFRIFEDDTKSENMPDFNFEAVYDDVSLFTTHIELGINVLEKTTFLLRSNFYKYKMDKLDVPYHKPEYDMSLLAKYSLFKELTLKARLSYISEVYAEQDITIDPKIDISLGGEYQISNSFSAFIDANNITASQNFYWNSYPSYGLNFLGGIKFVF